MQTTQCDSLRTYAKNGLKKSLTKRLAWMPRLLPAESQSLGQPIILAVTGRLAPAPFLVVQ